MPSLIRQVIDSRVTRLGEGTRQPLTIAAVIGHEFSLELLASVAAMPTDSLYAVIDRAIEWHLVSETRDGSGIQFVHALTREALYESMPLHRRRELHRRVAETLEARPSADADAIAYHYQQAGDPRAPDWLTRAGDRAQRAYAWLTARERFAAAAALLEDVPGEELARARLLYRCGRLQRYSSAGTAIESLRTAARLAERAGDPMLAADATYSQGLVQCFADAWAAGLPDMIRGIEALRALPPSVTYIPWATASWMADALPTITMRSPAEPSLPAENLVAIDTNRHMSLPWFLAEGGRIEEARALSESYQQVVPDRSIGPLAIANAGHAALGHAIALASLGEPDLADRAIDDALRAYREIDHHACIAFTYLIRLNVVTIPYRTDDVAGRRRHADDAGLAIEQARGAFTPEISPSLAQLPVLALDGRWDDVLAIGANLADFGTYVLRRQVTRTLPDIARHRGDPAGSWAHVDRILPDGPDADPGSAALTDALLLQQLAAHLSLDAGDPDDARRWLDANDRWLSESGSVLGRAENALGWARHAAIAGDLPAARAHIDRAVETASEPRQPLALVRARRLRGELALWAGELADAEGDLTAALELATSCGAVFERALSLEALAHLNAATDQSAARELAQEAFDIASDLKAAPIAARIEPLLAGLAAEPGAATSRLEGLTNRELDVLRLVARGMTDAEVADRLSISPRTVGQHLRSVYGKLHVRSRTEATRIAIERGLS